MARDRSSILAAAKVAKKDEFYTQWIDIEKEMSAYLEYDPSVFEGKTILLPCDDPEWSNFTKYFAQNFERFGLKKLISTSYAADSNRAGDFYQPSVFETDDPKFDSAKTRVNGKKFVLESNDVNGDGVIDINDLQWDYLDGSGDFRSKEVNALREEADIIITNPPFSLFRQYVSWIIEGGTLFAFIGSQNAITYKEVFPLIRNGTMWLGKGFDGNATHFYSPYEDTATATDRRDRMIRVSGVCWFTNIDHGRRHEPLPLMTKDDNVKFSQHKEVRGIGYKHYDNYDAIEVPFTNAIPADYEGVMGVPITFMNKHNPEQFEIVGITKTWFGAATKTYPRQIQVSASGKQSEVTKLNDGPALQINGPITKTHYVVNGRYYKQVYARILIRHKFPHF